MLEKLKQEMREFALNYWRGKPDIFGPGFKNIPDLAEKIIDHLHATGHLAPDALPEAVAIASQRIDEERGNYYCRRDVNWIALFDHAAVLQNYVRTANPPEAARPLKPNEYQSMIDDLCDKNRRLENLLLIIHEALERGEKVPSIVPLLRTAPLTNQDIEWAEEILKAKPTPPAPTEADQLIGDELAMARFKKQHEIVDLGTPGFPRKENPVPHETERREALEIFNNIINAAQPTEYRDNVTIDCFPLALAGIIRAALSGGKADE